MRGSVAISLLDIDNVRKRQLEIKQAKFENKHRTW